MILHIIIINLDQINGKIPRNGVIDQKTINPCDLCYQCSKDVPEFFFGEFSIRDCIDEPYFPSKRKLLSFQIKTIFLKNNGGRKIIIYDNNIHKSMRILYGIFKTNNK